MSLFVLDTDILSLLETNHPTVRARCLRLPPEQLAITVISIEERIGGWYTFIRQAKTLEKMAHGYHSLAETIRSLARFQILDFPKSALQRYEEWKRQKVRVRKMDLMIAAIVLETRGILITRNLHDFQRIPGLQTEDWSKSIP